MKTPQVVAVGVMDRPYMFLGAQLVMANKIELAETMQVSVEKLIEDVHKLKTGAGLDEVAMAILAV